jgi:predicted ATPase
MHDHLEHLLRCIRDDPQDGDTPTRYEAAHELEACFDDISERSDADDMLTEIAAAVTQLFLGSDESVQRAIETGFLEHVFEQPKLRRFFAHWESDGRLREAWQLCVAWGDAYPNFTKGLRSRLPPQSI